MEQVAKANLLVSTLYCSHRDEEDEIPETFLPIWMVIPVVLLLDTLCLFLFFFSLASRPTCSEFFGWDDVAIPSISTQA